MTKYYAAVDMGASSGRLILGHMENGRMELEEIHRFENGMVKKDGELCWEFDRIFKEIVAGLKKCKEIGKIPVSMGVDTWGVDFVLLDKDGNVVDVSAKEIEVKVDIDTIAATAVVVVNKAGTELPSTGGMGTSVFYVLGAVLVMGAVVLLVTKKRMSDANR